MPPDVAERVRREFGGEMVYIPRRERLDGQRVREALRDGQSVAEMAREMGFSRWAIYKASRRAR
jgi:hypothetical protein